MYEFDDVRSSVFGLTRTADARGLGMSITPWFPYAVVSLIVATTSLSAIWRATVGGLVRVGAVVAGDELHAPTADAAPAC